MIVLFKERWGSEPGSLWGYTSGTEEELFTGLLELGDSEQPMRDVWVTFMAAANPEQRVTQLREQMVREHSLLFEPIPGIRELKQRLSERLISWETMSKRPRHVDLISSTGREVLRAAKLRIAGEKLVDLGQPEIGRANLHDAAAIGGPAENLAYAQLLARQGELDAAYDSTQIAIDQCLTGVSELYTTLTAEAFAAQAGVLRRQGKTNAAVGILEHAITLLTERDPFSNRVRCRILDDLGIARQSLDDFDGAEAAFNEALDTRVAGKIDSDIAQSWVNLARLSVAAKDLPTALARAESANRHLKGSPPTALHANASTLSAQVQLRLGNPPDGVTHAEKALALNQQFANKTGEAIALLLLAQCFRANGDDARAADRARQCLQLNREMENEKGEARAQWLLDQLGAS